MEKSKRREESEGEYLGFGEIKEKRRGEGELLKIIRIFSFTEGLDLEN